MNSRVGQWVACGGMGLACLASPGLAQARDITVQCQLPVPSATSAWIETADYTGTIGGDVVRFTGRYVIRTLDAKGGQVFLQLPGATVTSLEVVKRSGDANILPRGDGYLVVMTRRGTTELEVRFAHLLVRDAQQEGIQFQLPQARESTVTMTLPHAEVELRPEDQLYVDQQPAGQGKVRLVAHRGTGSVIDLRWRPKATAQPPVAPVIHGEAHTLITVDDATLKVLATLRYRPTQGQTDLLRVRVPFSLVLLAVRGAGITDQQITNDGQHKILTIQLGTPLREGMYVLAIEAETPLAREAGQVQVPSIEMLGAKQERGVIAVAPEGSVELADGSVSGGTRIDVRELPEPFAASAAGAVLAYRYLQPGYDIAVRMTRHTDHPVLTAIVEQADLVSVLAPQGERMTRALYAIVANRAQYLPVRLPEGATLWSCLVDGASKKPVEGDPGVILIPLGHALTKARVELVYFERTGRLTGAGRLRLSGPRLAVPVSASTWAVYAPATMQWMRVGGNMEQGAGAVTFLDAWMPAAEAQTLHSRVYRTTDSMGQEMDSSGDRRQLQNTVRQGVMRATAAFSVSKSEGAASAPAAVEEMRRNAGILPLQIRVPTSGRTHQFHRLLIAEDAVTLEVTYVVMHAWAGWAGLACGLVAAAALGGRRFLRA